MEVIAAHSICFPREFAFYELVLRPPLNLPGLSGDEWGVLVSLDNIKSAKSNFFSTCPGNHSRLDELCHPAFQVRTYTPNSYLAFSRIPFKRAWKIPLSGTLYTGRRTVDLGDWSLTRNRGMDDKVYSGRREIGKECLPENFTKGRYL